MFNKGNMGKMLKQAQAMQSKMAHVQEGLKDVIIEESTAGLFTVKLNGKLEILDVTLSDEAMSEDKDLLEDIILTTMKKALQKAQEEAATRMDAITGNMLGGLNFPGM
ncbi:MAG: YbaB/EbfC family nucleoid-associated protein [Candidatus Marinimicrobia bacterium]|nr:YbaB/EbfC family nucleoid-associated protein [Candidatus Neomarinimicrobiota bacterium]MCH7763188.1 YbaB/EbfC family nucleoid-associated protein [Candidatus Neomarinimicrobiota bacterium]